MHKHGNNIQNNYKQYADQVRAMVDTYLYANILDPADYGIASILIAALFVGPNILAIQQITGCDSLTVALVDAKLRQSGVWIGEDVYYEDWSDSRSGDVAFLADLSVALGLVVRKGKRCGKYVYISVEYLGPDQR